MRVEESRWDRLAAQVADGTEFSWDEEKEWVEGDEDGELLGSCWLLGEVARSHGMEPDGPEPWSWGPLQVTGVLGEGSDGPIYLARTKLGEEVILRFLQGASQKEQERVRRRINEARRLARIRHPNLLRIQGVERHGGMWGMWADRLPGKSLDAIVREDGSLGEREAAFVALEVCRGLDAIHKAGLLHGNLSPRSVFRTEMGNSVLADLGPAPEDPSAAPAASAHLAPEITFGDPPSPQADLYSLGVLLYFMATGEFPARVTGLEGVSRVSPPPRRLVELRPGLSPELQALVARAISSNVPERYGAAAEFEAGLTRLVAGRDKVRSTSAGFRSRVWLALLLAVLLLLGAWWLLARTPLVSF